MPKPWVMDDSTPTRARALFAHTVSGSVIALMLAVIILAQGAFRHQTYTPPSANIARLIQIALFSLPVLAIALLSYDAMRYRLRPGEVVFSKSAYWKSLRDSWWEFAPLWPGTVVSAIAWWEKLTG